ncbi:hypothetical protein H1R20_g10480, partial [Candolleomyces eurysporus]
MSSSEKTPLLDQDWHDSVSKIVESIIDGRGDLDKTLVELNGAVRAGAAAGVIDVTKVLVGAIQGARGQELVDSVKDLANTINKLDKSFAHAHQLLENIDGKQYKRADGSSVEYALKWQNLRKGFGQLITKSKDIASEGKAFTEVYMQKIPPLLKELHQVLDAPETKAETLQETKRRAEKPLLRVKAVVSGLQNDMTTLKEKSASLSSESTELSQKVGFLHADLSADINVLSDKVDEDLANAEREVEGLKAELASLKQKLDNCFTSIYASGGSTAGGALLGCGAAALACPILIPGVLFGVAGAAFFSMIGSGTATAVYQGKVTAAELDLANAQKRLEEMKSKHSSLVQSKSDVASIGQDVADIQTRLKTIIAIWNVVESDATQLNAWLEQSFNNKDIPVESIVSDLEQNNIGTIYSVLGQYLQEYTIQLEVAASGGEPQR